jgi:hypothetical protein
MKMTARIVPAFVLMNEENGNVISFAFSKAAAQLPLAHAEAYAPEDSSMHAMFLAEITQAKALLASSTLPEETTAADYRYAFLEVVAGHLAMAEDRVTNKGKRGVPKAPTGFAICYYVRTKDGLRLAFSCEAFEDLLDSAIIPLGPLTREQVQEEKKFLANPAVFPFPPERVSLDEEFLEVRY